MHARLGALLALEAVLDSRGGLKEICEACAVCKLHNCLFGDCTVEMMRYRSGCVSITTRLRDRCSMLPLQQR